MPARPLFRLGVLVVASALVVVAAGCGSGSSSNAYSIDGRAHSDSSFQRELRALRDNKQLQAVIAQGGGPSTTAKGTIDPKITASWLQQDLEQAVADREFAQRHLKTSALTKQELTSYTNQFFSTQKVFDAFPKWFRDLELGRFSRFLILLGPKPSDAELQKTFEQLKATNCPSGKLVAHILLKTKPEADAVYADLFKGADFATTAAQKSTDTQSAQQGGQLGCLTPGQYVKEFEDAANALQPGTVSQPVQSQYGWHIIKVTELTFESARATVEQQSLAQQNQKLLTHLSSVLSKAHVTINPKYGTVVKKPKFTISPPKTPSVSTRPKSGSSTSAPVGLTPTTQVTPSQGGTTPDTSSTPNSTPAASSIPAPTPTSTP
jgi:parvulin-like peptidyl-prolyl isomerase